MDDFDLAFDTLAACTGQAYERHKAAFLPGLPALRTRLLEKAQAPDWNSRVTARILLGYGEHGAAYRQFAADVGSADIAREADSAGGLDTIWRGYQAVATRGLGSAFCPLCWEIILKHRHDYPDWQYVCYVRILWVCLDSDSADPLAWLVATAPDSAAAGDAVKALAALPDESLAGKVAAARRRLARSDELFAQFEPIKARMR